MSPIRAFTFSLVCLTAGSLAAQASDNTTRNLSTEKVAFKLPPGWEWQSEIAANIAIKKDVKIKDRTLTVTAEMIFAAEGFLEDSIKDIEKKVAASKGDLKDLKIKRGEKFAGNSAVLVSFTRVRGDDPNEFEDERQWLMRRNNALYTWTERAQRMAQSQASGAFSAARSAVAFTEKDLTRVPRTFDEPGIRYTVPVDWEFENVKPVKDPKMVGPVMIIESHVTIKGEPWRINCVLFAYKDQRTLSDFQKKVKEEVTEKFVEIEGYEENDKDVFNGEKALSTTFTGRYVPDEQAPKQPTTRRREFTMRRKGHLIRWIEQTPATPSPAVDAALKKARAGLSWN
jgi:hypothetical protein